MVPYPFSLLIVPAAVLLGVIYVTLGRARSRRARMAGRLAVLALTWTSPLVTTGPGPVQLALGLIVGFLGIRMVALGQRWKGGRRLPPTPARVLAAMVTPEQLLTRAPFSVRRPVVTLMLGLLAAGACVGLLVVGNELRLWRWSRLVDDWLVLIEVGLGTAGFHRIIVGIAGLAGHAIAGLQDRPLLSSSFSDFWSRRWNRLVQGNLDRGFFRPYGRRRLGALGTATAFGAAGVMHVIAVFDPERIAITLGPAAAVMGFFVIHAALVIEERRWGLHRQPQRPSELLVARIRTVAIFALLSPLLLDPFASIVHVHGRTLGP
jgi:hypothetical protein